MVKNNQLSSKFKQVFFNTGVGIMIVDKNRTLITSSLGSGVGDIQFLFAEDILGNTKGPYPRHSK